MELLKDIWGGLLDLPLFIWILFFKSGLYSVVAWFNVIVCVVLFYFEYKGNRKEREATAELIQQKVKLTKLKRYAKLHTEW